MVSKNPEMTFTYYPIIFLICFQSSNLVLGSGMNNFKITSIQNSCTSPTRTIPSQVNPTILSTLETFESQEFTTTSPDDADANNIQNLCTTTCPIDCCNTPSCKEYYNTNGMKIRSKFQYSISYGGVNTHSGTVSTFNTENCIKASAPDCLNAATNRILMIDSTGRTFHI